MKDMKEIIDNTEEFYDSCEIEDDDITSMYEEIMEYKDKIDTFLSKSYVTFYKMSNDEINAILAELGAEKGDVVFIVADKDKVVLPTLGVIGSAFMVFAAIYSHGYLPYITAKEAGQGFTCPVFFYLIVFAVIMAVGMALMKPKKSK